MGKLYKSSFGIGISAVFLMLSSIFVVAKISHADNGLSSQSGRLITVYDNGNKKIFLTQESTIGDALKQGGVSVESGDLVEPATGDKLVASDYTVNIYRARPIVVVDGIVRQKVLTAYQTPSQIAEAAGITLYPEDSVVFGQNDSLTDGASAMMTITRARLINLNLFGKVSQIRTQAKTVGDLLSEKNIKIEGQVYVSPDKNTPIADSMNVKVWQEGHQVVSVDEPINFTVDTTENADQPLGYRLVKQAGQNGVRSVAYEVVFENGVEVSRSEVASVVTKEPVKQIEIIGVKGKYTTPSENEYITWNFLISNGFSRVQTAGIMGNLMQEHGFRTDGDGLAQWIGARKDRLYSLPNPDNIYTQLEFLMSELNGGYASVRDAIKASNSLVESVQIFQNRFERCGFCREDNRIRYAQEILARH